MCYTICISAGIFMVIENFFPENLDEPYTFHVTLYFIAATISTVGYGDFYPKSDEGKIFILTLILYVIVVKVPKITADLVSLLGSKSPYERFTYQHNPEIPHIVITGHVMQTALENFTLELLHPDHGSTERVALIIQPNEPNNSMKMFLHDPKHSNVIKYRKGNAMHPFILKKVSCENAHRCIILTNKNSVDAQEIDHKNILIGLAIKKYVNEHTGRNLRLCMQLIKPESK